MTAYVALRELPLDRIVRAAPYDAEYGESLLELRPGQRISVRDLLYGLILRSGNDAAYDLALAAAGSEPRFVAEMNRYAAALGLADTHYANPIGLDQEGNYSSARDLATLTRRLLRDPRLRPDRRRAQRRAAQRAPAARGSTTLNELLLHGALGDRGEDRPHLRRRSTSWSAPASARASTLISVVIGAPTEKTAICDNLDLLDYGFSLYERRLPVRAGSDARRGRRFATAAASCRCAPPARSPSACAPTSASALAVRAPSEVEGPIAAAPRWAGRRVYVDGRRAAVGAAARRARGGRGEPARPGAAASSVTEKIPVGIALCVILVGAVLLRRFSR